MVDPNRAGIRTLYRRLRAFAGRPLLVRQQNIVTVADLEYCEDPIFVLGCHRSGTSLLRRILNSHPRIACPPESNFLIHFFQMLNDESAISGLAGMIDKERVVHEVTRQAFRFHEAFRVATGKARWADKTPQYVAYYEDIVRYAPPGTQIVVILRNPLDIAYSIFDRGWVLEHLDDDLAINTCLYVRNTVEKLIEISRQPGVHTLRYEDLVTRSIEETKKLCAYLNEPWDEAMTRPWDFQHNFGTEDPIARSRKNFELSSNNWKGLAPDVRAKFLEILGPVCDRLRYETR
jgi:hypothetical protein